MSHYDESVAKIEKIKRWSPVWIVPIVTALIGAWVIFYHFNNQGPEVTLVTTNAEGLVGGKTAIKSRSVDVGLVESVTLNDDLSQVTIRARLNAGMEKLLRKDSVFWVVKPQVGREGVSGLGTLLSGAYIELQPGNSKESQDEYRLLDQPPLASPDAKGIRIVLESEQSGQLSPGDPVLFRGLKVGTVETGKFDTEKRIMRYQLFISSPYDLLVTDNVRFWLDSGVAFDLSSAGIRVEMSSLSTLFSGGVSFDVPQGWDIGEKTKGYTVYQLFANSQSIQDSLYNDHKDVVMFFSDTIRGLQVGAPVEFHGIRLGTVAQVPYQIKGPAQKLDSYYRIPVLVRIELDRIQKTVGGEKKDVLDMLLRAADNDNLRASLRSGNLLTGALYIDLDFYPQAKPWNGEKYVAGYPVLPTIKGGLAQMQQKLTAALDKFNNLPLEPMLMEATNTLKASQATMAKTQKTIDSLNNILTSKELQTLPLEMQKTLQELNRSIKGFQPGSPAYNKMLGDMQRLDQVLRELQPLLKTLNVKSNALVFEASVGKDPQPKRAK